MFRKSYLYLFLVAAISLTAQMSAYSQTTGVNGTVVLQKADKTTEPVGGAMIEAYRTDVKGGFPSTKTNKKGEFTFVGMQYGSEYVFSVSAPNCAPTLFPVKAGEEKLVITMNPGDGHKFTEAEARKGVADAPKSGGLENSGSSEEEKKAQAEIERKNAEIMARNEKTKAGDEIAIRANAEGNAALKAENYDLAIAKYSEGVAAVPDFVGSTPIMLDGKMMALNGKGVKLYNDGAKSGDAALRKAKFEEANKAYDDGLGAFQEAIGVIKRAQTATDPVEQKKRETMTLKLFETVAETHRLKAFAGDTSKTAEANTIFSEYFAMETDPVKKIRVYMAQGDMMRRTGEFEKAVKAYREVLVLKPDHAEAMGWLGLSLFGQGVAMSPEDKEMQQEGLNYMQKYIDMSPVSPTDTPQVAELKKSIKESVDYLKSQKMAPQKVATPRKKQ